MELLCNFYFIFLFKRSEEYWNSKTGELDTLKVVRNVPVIHILLSTQPVDPQENGYFDSRY